MSVFQIKHQWIWYLIKSEGRVQPHEKRIVLFLCLTFKAQITISTFALGAELSVQTRVKNYSSDTPEFSSRSFHTAAEMPPCYCQFLKSLQNWRMPLKMATDNDFILSIHTFTINIWFSKQWGIILVTSAIHCIFDNKCSLGFPEVLTSRCVPACVCVCVFTSSGRSLRRT